MRLIAVLAPYLLWNTMCEKLVWLTTWCDSLNMPRMYYGSLKLSDSISSLSILDQILFIRLIIQMWLIKNNTRLVKFKTRLIKVARLINSTDQDGPRRFSLVPWGWQFLKYDALFGVCGCEKNTFLLGCVREMFFSDFGAIFSIRSLNPTNAVQRGAPVQQLGLDLAQIGAQFCRSQRRVWGRSMQRGALFWNVARNAS